MMVSIALITIARHTLPPFLQVHTSQLHGLHLQFSQDI
jgi:hypothetical protein